MKTFVMRKGNQCVPSGLHLRLELPFVHCNVSITSGKGGGGGTHHCIVVTVCVTFRIFTIFDLFMRVLE